MFVRRSLARLIDLVILIAAGIGPLAFALSYLPDYMDAPAGQPPTPLMGVLFLWMAIVLLGYAPLFESGARAATPGKILTGLKVVKSNGDRMTFQEALYRWMLGPFFLWLLPWYRYQFSGGAEVRRR